MCQNKGTYACAKIRLIRQIFLENICKTSNIFPLYEILMWHFNLYKNLTTMSWPKYETIDVI